MDAGEIKLGNDNTRIQAFTAMSYNALGVSKNADEVVRILKIKLDASILGGSPAYHLAMIFSHKGDVEKAFFYLDQAFEKHEIEMFHLKTEPPLEALHSDPRWQEMLGKVGVPMCDNDRPLLVQAV